MEKNLVTMKKILPFNNILCFYNFNGLDITIFFAFLLQKQQFTWFPLQFQFYIKKVEKQAPNPVRIFAVLERFGETGSKYTKS